MSGTPETIIAEFEERRAAERTVGRRRVMERTYDVVQAVLLLGGFVFVATREAASGRQSYEIILGVVLFSILLRHVERRWALEDRVALLERKQTMERRDSPS